MPHSVCTYKWVGYLYQDFSHSFVQFYLISNCMRHHINERHHDLFLLHILLCSLLELPIQIKLFHIDYKMAIQQETDWGEFNF